MLTVDEHDLIRRKHLVDVTPNEGCQAMPRGTSAPRDVTEQKSECIERQIAPAAVQVPIGDSSFSIRPAFSPSGENSRMKVQNVVVDSTANCPR